jgi:TatD DNase family protein
MIDVHCHIDQFPKPFEIAQKAEKSGILTIAVTKLPEHFELGYPRLFNFKRVRLALGCHPMISGNEQFNEKLFAFLASKTSYIGEIGLDFSKDNKTERRQQINTLQKILQIINDRPRFLSLHSREAESTLLDLLVENSVHNGVFHWYSGPSYLIDRAITSGHYFSINPAMSKNKKGQKVIERIPPTRILTETDGPYLKIKGRSAEPKDVRLVIRYLHKVWSLPMEEIEKQIELNFNTLIEPIKKFRRH